MGYVALGYSRLISTTWGNIHVHLNATASSAAAGVTHQNRDLSHNSATPQLCDALSAHCLRVKNTTRKDYRNSRRHEVKNVSNK